MKSFPITCGRGLLCLLWDADHLRAAIVLEHPKAWRVPVYITLPQLRTVFLGERPLHAHSIVVSEDLEIRYCGRRIGKLDPLEFRQAVRCLAEAARESASEVARRKVDQAEGAFPVAPPLA